MNIDIKITLEIREFILKVDKMPSRELIKSATNTSGGR